MLSNNIPNVYMHATISNLCMFIHVDDVTYNRHLKPHTTLRKMIQTALKTEVGFWL